MSALEEEIVRRTFVPERGRKEGRCYTVEARVLSMWRREDIILNSLLFNCTIYMAEQVRGSGRENVLVYSISKYNVCNSVTTGQDQMTTVKMLCPSSQGTGYGYCILLGYLRMPGRCMPVSSHPERFILHNCSLLVYTLIEVLHSPVQSKDF